MNGLAVAQFHLYHSHTFRKDKPATFAISREDEIFLLLVFLYSETKRQDAEVRMAFMRSLRLEN